MDSTHVKLFFASESRRNLGMNRKGQLSVLRNLILVRKQKMIGGAGCGWLCTFADQRNLGTWRRYSNVEIKDATVLQNYLGSRSFSLFELVDGFDIGWFQRQFIRIFS